MKYFFIIIFIQVFTSSITKAQFSAFSYNDKRIEEFKNNKTMVILSGDKNYDEAIIEAMNNLWVIGKFDTIKPKELKSFICKKGFNYMFNINVLGGQGHSTKFSSSINSSGGITTTANTSAPSNLSQKTYHNFGIVIGDDRKIRAYEYGDMVVYTPIDYYGIENNQLDIYTRMPIVIYNLQNAIEVVLQNKISGNTASIVKKLMLLYNQNAGKLKDKTLLVYQDRSQQLSKEEFGKIYPYKFEYCDMDKIMDAIKVRDKNYAYFCPGITLNKTTIVYDIETYMPLQFDYQMMGLKINKGDIEDLVKEIKRSHSNTIKFNYIKFKEKTNESAILKSEEKTSKSTAMSIDNTSAIAHGESNIKSEAVAKVYKYKAEETAVDYYKDLRKKFEVEEKEKKEKDALLAKEKAKKEEEFKDSRHLKEDQAPQFDKFRQGATNPVEKKSTPEEDYNKLFK